MNNLSVYPNPANSTLNIEVKTATSIKIVDLLGATVAVQELNAGTNRIDVSNLISGVYFVQAGSSVVKFIKE
ncbi:MAG TPA: T9SS type A sorting domain-containing protein [Crocinitomicaceae bacterium]|nr:T9SS type A sorting domain-containing protein [Crocinitomicaceae bacterium]